MRNELPAIKLDSVSKIYRLYSNPRHQVLDLLGLGRLLGGKRAATEFHALNNVSLQIGHGERVGIIGRNGAGKTTLLKLITGNFGPTSGRLDVNGNIQALMTVGLGFIGDFSGYENIRSALIYNGLSGADFERALEDVIDFVELGEFLHQPFKTYSLGMRSRLQFAAATAIKPDILIVDEILGAGDAYFSTKSAARMKALTNSGCTLLLVSHSTSQILQFCERGIWIERGEVMTDGDVLTAVKDYEQFIKNMEYRAKLAVAQAPVELPVQESPLLRNETTRALMLERAFPNLPASNCASDKVSQWSGHPGLKISAVRVLDGDGKLATSITTGDHAVIELEVEATEDGNFPCFFHVFLFTEEALPIQNICSDAYHFDLKAGERRIARLDFGKLCLGTGKFVFTAGIYKTLDRTRLETAVYYDLFGRSFVLNVTNPLTTDTSIVLLPHEWSVQE